MKVVLLIAFLKKKTGLCLTWSQRFKKTFAHESKYLNISLNTSADT